MKPLLDEHAAADLIGFSVKTLQNWRYQGLGPKFIRIGRTIKYDVDDIVNYLAKHRVGSTSQLVAA